MPKGKNNKLDTGLGNLTWGLLPIGFQGVMRKEAIDLDNYYHCPKDF
jgi:hypothetical protein|tara:strand:+ start:754 stop:894 length:141 start_codon:yes stop_codon:yes gene_type:complete